ncbi:MAG: thiamine phosphate synthase [Actinomycetota bacterium]|nr:thiamine phosphate synthase [Actinomycetota bacterium]
MTITTTAGPGPAGWSLDCYLVTDRALCAGRGLEATVAAAVAGGATVVQLRDPHASGRQLFDLATGLLQCLEGTGVPLVVDDRLDVALAAGAHGVHLGQADLPVAAARRLAGPDLVIGWSVHDLAELEAATRLPPGTVDYLGFGPVYPTTTKTDAKEPLGLDRLARLVAASPLPAVAIGGITVARAAAVWATGVDGLAVVSAVCAADDPGAAASAIRAARSAGRR